MKISSNLGRLVSFYGPERAIELMAEAGFDAYDFSMFELIRYDYKNKQPIINKESPLVSKDYLAYAKHLRDVADRCGIVCNQTHAPYPVFCEEIRASLKWAIDITSILGGRQCIIHPDNNATAEENAEMYRELLPYAKEKNVKIATENMWNWDKEKDQACAAACSHHDDFLAHVKALDDEYLIACLDIGHAEMRGLNTDAVKMIETLGGTLEALHVHDNDKWHDSHAVPFTMEIDFDAICKALKRVGYKGDMTLEVYHKLDKNSDGQAAVAWLSELASVAKRLRKMFEEA